MYVGIDPGITGAIAFLCGEEAFVQRLPVIGTGRGAELCIPALNQLALLRQQKHTPIALVVLERVRSMPGQGVASAFKFGWTYGELRGWIRAHGWPLVEPAPRTWKQKVLADMDWKGNKGAAILYCQRRWPAVSLRPTPESRKADHNLAEALCLAEYGRIVFDKE